MIYLYEGNMKIKKAKKSSASRAAEVGERLGEGVVNVLEENEVCIELGVIESLKRDELLDSESTPRVRLTKANMSIILKVAESYVRMALKPIIRKVLND
jgi:hypothetical protein